MISRALAEFFKNAWQWREKDGVIEADWSCRKGLLVLKLTEPKTAAPLEPEKWGLEPLVSTRRGGFGMGLYYARQVIRKHRGGVEFAFNAAKGEFMTHVTLPLAPR